MSTLRTLRKEYWLPAMIFLIGGLSVFLLLWSDRIAEKQRIQADLVDVLMDVQIHAAKAHLWVEQLLLGGTESDVNSFMIELSQAINLINVSLEGGESEHDWIPEPLAEPEQRARANEIKHLLLNLRQIGLQSLETHDHSKEDRAFHLQFNALFNEIIIQTRALEVSMEIDEAINELKYRRLFLIVLVIWIMIILSSTLIIVRSLKKKRRSEQKLQRANEKLSLQTKELMEHREHLFDLVDMRTAELRLANEIAQFEISERLQTCELLNMTERQVRALSERLLRAQEIERKRISMELHDELGSDLNVMKLQLRTVKNSLKPDQVSEQSDCEKILEYMDQVIENVRRISLNLSPTILEDLGLTTALHWLMNNLSNASIQQVKVDIADIDQLFPVSQWITIYRVMQEALNNILKHAQAENVKIVVQRQSNMVTFLIEDDGCGFDPEKLVTQDVAKQNLGLTTMSERVRILGGAFDFWSRLGEGTRITFSFTGNEGAG
jgi:signal transduction histidine kinase